MNLTDVPFFVAPYKDEAGGVDFLGLRQVNLDLMYQFMPGINNVTWYVRPYSVMTWCAWAFEEEMKRQGIESFQRKDFRAFREKVELLFGWSHLVEKTDRGMVGSTSKPPRASGKVPLNFKAWSRNVSWLDAVNYGPSLKMDNGLGLLTQVKRGIFAVSTRGAELAQVLDAELRKCSSYKVLRTDTEDAPEAVARELHAGWNIDKPSARECKVLWSALFDESAVGRQDAMGRRSSAIRLIEIVLRAARRPLEANEVREILARGAIKKGRVLEVPPALVSHHQLWTVVQVRQAQRLAMEAFFTWIEHQVLLVGIRDSQALAKKASKILLQHTSFLEGMATPGMALAKLRSYAAREKWPLWRGTENRKLDMFAVMSDLRAAIDESEDGAKDLCPLAMNLLLLTAAITGELAALPVPKEFLDRGGLPRVSLAYWSRYVATRADQNFAPFLTSFIEIFMLSQHFGTATRRYEVGKQRLRVTIEERGLTPMIAADDLWQPSPAADRIEAMLSLMADCGVIEEDDGSYSL